MILKEIKLKTFKCFEDYSVSFEKINLIQGAIGIGKSTILQALIFALFGYSEGILADLPTRGKATSCKVTAIIEDNGHVVEVIREFPLKLTVKEDGKTLKMSTSEGNTYLVDRFGSRQDFFQFRIVDAYSKETNLLEQGNVVFKKILFAGADEKFNEIRNNLNVIKLERERLNRDGIVLDICYPSEKRLEVLNASLNDVINRYREMDGDISLADKGLRDSEIKLSEHENKIVYLTKQINDIDNIRSSFDSKLIQNESRHTEIQRTVGDLNKQIEETINQRGTVLTNYCYACKQPLKINKDILVGKLDTEIKKLDAKLESMRNEDIEICRNIPILKESIIKERLQKVEQFKKEIENLQTENVDLIEDIKNTKEIIAQDKDIRDNLLPKKEKIQSLKVKLENRLKQRQFIYTERDVIIVKKAIEELDKLSSVYLVETVGSLEPIINSVLEKIGFQIKFDVDTKGKFNILLSKEDIQYKYSDLSCGQRLILQIALKLSLLLQQSKTGIILSDEGLSALENNNLEDIINLFKELNFQLVFVLQRASIEDPEINIIKLGGNDEKMSEV